MAVTETLQLQGVSEFEAGLRRAAGAIDGLAASQVRSTSARKKLTAAQKAARAVDRERRRQRRAAIRQQKQQKQQIRELAQAIVGYTSLKQALFAVLASGITTVKEMVFGFATLNNENAKMARGIGVSAGELAQMEFVLSRVTSGGVDAGQVLSQVGRRAFDAAQGGAEAQRTFDALGVSFQDRNGEVRSSVDVFRDLQRAFRETVPEQERLGLASRIFGEDQARNVLPALVATRGELDGASQAFQRFNGDMLASTAAAEAQEDRLGDLRLAYTGLSQVIGQTLSPFIQAVASGLAEGTAAITTGLRRVLGLQSEMQASARGDVVALTARERATASLNNALAAQAEILERQAGGDVRAGDVEVLAALDAQIPLLEQRNRSLEETAQKEAALADQQRIKAQLAADEAVRRRELEQLVRRTESAVAGLGQTEAQVAATRLQSDLETLQRARQLGLLEEQEAQRRADRLRKEFELSQALEGRKDQEIETVMAALEGVGVKEEQLHAQRVQRMEELFERAVALGALTEEEASARLERFTADTTERTEVAAISAEQTVEQTIGAMDGLVGAVGQLSQALGVQQDSALAKGLKLTQTMLKATGQIVTSILSITATSLASSEITKSKTVADMAVIGATAATPATLTATATGGGAAIAAISAIIGAIGAIAGIASAIAPVGATSEFLSRLPAIDNAGHRLVGVKPNETILDPASTRSHRALLDVARETMRGRNEAVERRSTGMGGFGFPEINIQIGGQQLQPIVNEALDYDGRFLGAAA